jgi:hypothetical protein
MASEAFFSFVLESTYANACTPTVPPVSPPLGRHRRSNPSRRQGPASLPSLPASVGGLGWAKLAPPTTGSLSLRRLRRQLRLVTLGGSPLRTRTNFRQYSGTRHHLALECGSSYSRPAISSTSATHSQATR